MANTVSLATIRTAIRERGEISDVYVTDTVMDSWINSAIKDLYDHILTVNQDYFVSVSNNISISSGTDSYSLPSDFAHLLRTEVLYQGDNDWRPLERFMLSERSNYTYFDGTKLNWRYRVMGDLLYISPVPTESGTVRLWYVPVPPTLSDDADTEDFIFGWDEYVILDCLIRHAQKEESDHMPFAAKQAACLERILSRAKQRDYGETNSIRDMDEEFELTRIPWILP